MADDVLTEVDRDLAVAWLERHNAWLARRVKDSPSNRANFDAASAAFDDLLDMRNDMIAAERMVAS